MYSLFFLVTHPTHFDACTFARIATVQWGHAWSSLLSVLTRTDDTKRFLHFSLQRQRGSRTAPPRSSGLWSESCEKCSQGTSDHTRLTMRLEGASAGGGPLRKEHTEPHCTSLPLFPHTARITLMSEASLGHVRWVMWSCYMSRKFSRNLGVSGLSLSTSIKLIYLFSAYSCPFGCLMQKEIPRLTVNSNWFKADVHRVQTHS